jgi:hypothetical protein
MDGKVEHTGTAEMAIWTSRCRNTSESPQTR